jgi:starch synthase (maltosyl-transferring)
MAKTTRPPRDRGPDDRGAGRPPTPQHDPDGVAPPPRVVVEHVAPTVAGGRFPVKRVVGEPVDVGATAYADGHDELHVVVVHEAPDDPAGAEPERVVLALTEPGLDRWSGRFTPRSRGLHRFRVLAWVDHLASWRHATLRKLDAGQDVSSELLAGAALFEAAAVAMPPAGATPPAAPGGAAGDAPAGALVDDAALVLAAAARLRAGELVDVTDPGGPGRASAIEAVRRHLPEDQATASAPVEVLVERERALFSTWYELFPRSWSTDPDRRPHGTLADVTAQLGYVADLGFDVLYLPPVHPIGTSHRKGPDNAEQAGPGDPGSPWAIGAAEGGHTAVHPDLGTLDDLRTLVATAAESGIEVALDLAFQCSPDHPWVIEHPEWFRHRPDGTIQYAENPPKRYQDIYPLDFETPAWASLWEALIDVGRFWLAQGVRIFRVDNPHTKPFAFWERFTAELRAEEPDVIFLSEAFTRPAVMHRLAQVGFTQSYTYFPWRTSKAELTEYFEELASPPSVDELRPSAWPTTPDILPWQLQDAPRQANAVRAFLAATLSPSYGIYGPVFELAANEPAHNGKEEFGRSEKYEVRRWDLADPDSLRDLLAALNRARHGQLALHTLRTLRFHAVDDDALLAYSKTAHDGPDPDPATPHRNPVLCVANLDPGAVRTSTAHLDLVALGLDPARPFQVHDLLTDRHFTWQGPDAYVELHPDVQPGHVLRVSQEPL